MSSTDKAHAASIIDIMAAGRADAPAIGAPDRAPLSHGGLREQIARTAERTQCARHRPRRPRRHRAAERPGNGGVLRRARRHRRDGAAQPRLPGRRARFLPRATSTPKAILVGEDEDGPAVDVAKRLGIGVLRLHFAPDQPAGSFTHRGRCRSARLPRPAMPGRTTSPSCCTPRAPPRVPSWCRSARPTSRPRPAISARRSASGRRRRLPQHHAAVPHPRADRRRAVLARRRRQRRLHAGLQRAALLPVARRCQADLVHGGADHAPGDPVARRAQSRDRRCRKTPLHPLLLGLAAGAGHGRA